MRNLIWLALAACTTADATPADIRPIGSFHGLDITIVIDVDVTIGPATRVELRGPAEWTAKVSTEVTDGVLRIALPDDAHDVPKLSAVITVPDLTSLAVSGVAGVHVAKLAAKTFDVNIDGVGSVELAGTADTLRVEISGSGQLSAKDLSTRTTRLDVSGSAEATIRASQEVDATVSGASEVTVLGKPTVVQKLISGVSVIHD